MKKIISILMIVFVVFLNGQTTTWNGSSWSAGTPSSTKDAIIAGNYSASANISAKNFTINPGFVYTIPSNFRLTIYDAFINNGVLIVNSDASLIQRSNESVYSGFGVVIIRREANLKQKDYNYWSSPVIGQNLFNFSQGTPKGNFYKYNEANDRFVTTGITDFSIFEPGIGYAIRGKDSYSPTAPTKEIFTFNGVPNNGNIRVTLKRSPGLDKGYNLIGNPYPSNLSFKSLTSASTNRNAIFNKQWLWTNLNEVIKQQGSSYAGNNYATYVSSVGGVGPTYISSSIEEVTLRPQENTKIGQGFIVQAKSNNAVLTFNNSMRSTTTGKSVFYNKNNDDEEEPEEEIIDRYWLKFVNPDNVANNILMAHIAEATDDFDEDYDSASLSLGSDAFYSIINSNKLQIQARALPIKDSGVIELGYKTSKEGNCVIALNDKEGIFKTENKAIYLKDNQTGVITNLQDEYYTFASTGENNDTRFSILYENPVLSTNSTKDQEVSVYKQNNELVAKSNVNISNVEVFDVSGRMIKNAVGNNTKEIRINTDALNKGVYILKITTAKGITTKKVII